MDPVINLFYNESGSYAKNLQFEVLILITFITAFLFIYAPKTYGFVILLLALLYFISNNYINLQTSKFDDFNKITMTKLQSLQDISNKYILSLGKLGYKPKIVNNLLNNNKLDSLYLDANLISFLYSIIDLNSFNSKEFFFLLENTNNILKIRRQIEDYINANNGKTPENIAQMFESAINLKTKAINNVHNFIYSVPKINKMFQYIEDIIDRYSVLISRNTDIINSYYQYHLKNTKINTMTKFVSYNETKPFNIHENYPIHVTKNKNDKLKTLKFYI
jgi:hypothetical protein